MGYTRDRDASTRGVGAIAAADMVSRARHQRRVAVGLGTRERDRAMTAIVKGALGAVAPPRSSPKAGARGKSDGRGTRTSGAPATAPAPQAATGTNVRDHTGSGQVSDKSKDLPPAAAPAMPMPGGSYTPPVFVRGLPQGVRPPPRPDPAPQAPKAPVRVTAPPPKKPPAPAAPGAPIAPPVLAPPSDGGSAPVSGGGGGSSSGTSGGGGTMSPPIIAPPGEPDLAPEMPSSGGSHTMLFVAGGAALLGYFLFIRKPAKR